MLLQLFLSMNTCCTRRLKSSVQQVLAVYMRRFNRSTALCRQIGCSYVPLAEKILTIGLTRGLITREGVEQMIVVLDLASVDIL